MSTLDVPVALAVLSGVLGFLVGVYTVHRFPNGFGR